MGPFYHLGSVSTSRSLLHQYGVLDYRIRRRSVSNLLATVDKNLLQLNSMFLPFPVLLKSHIQKRKKFALLGLLALGTFITIIQVLRIRTVRNLANYLDSGSLIMWSTVENNLGIIVASIPTLAPLFKYFVEKTQKSSNGNSATRSRSMYGLKSRRTTRQGSIPLGSGVHQTTHVSGPFEGGSEEFIMGDIAAITKKTEVTVSSRVREESDRSGK